MAAAYPPIPYGDADFKRIRLTGSLYVDKTRFLRRLEKLRFAVLIRPRRFGKSCWISLLEHYYDRNRADAFDTVFRGTDIGREPTDERHRHVVLRFDFSAFDDTLETLESNFEEYCRLEIRHALERNPDVFSESAARRILAPVSVAGVLNELFVYAGDHGIPSYVLIDEYDHFTNTILAHHGEAPYHGITHGGGFYRNFFAALKAGAGRNGLQRLFITGVSPITLDDVTSGFNIGDNISLEAEFNELLGFTEPEVRGLLETYRDLGVFDQHVDEALDTMRDWYDGYRFAANAARSVYNTDMVLYYLNKSVPNRPMPEYLIDTNVRVDYGKLRHLLVAGRQLNGNFDLLRRVAGEERAACDLQPGFPVERLTRRENFLSLLHFFGLLSIREVVDGRPVLAIPNQTVRRLLYGFLRDAYDDVGTFAVDLYAFDRLTSAMANAGAWRPVFEFLRDAIAAQTGIRDYIAGEKVLQGFLAAYLSVNPYFVFRSETELGKGYADIALEPLLARYPHLRRGYLIELKYFKRSERLDPDQRDAAARTAAGQLQRYLADDRLARQYPGIRFIGLVLVFHGWELVHSAAVESAPVAGTERGPAAPPGRRGP